MGKEFLRFYIPHYAILKETSSTTKLRVVFNGSEKSSNGVSLNSILMISPKVQDNLFDLVQIFRLHRIVMSSDVVKMYRQVWEHPEDMCLQRILWRKTPDHPITTYELNTATYGTASVLFFASRCLQQLIEVEAIKFH